MLVRTDVRVYSGQDPPETHDARIRLWARKSAWDDGLDPVLGARVREWVTMRRPFERVTFEERDQ